MMRSIGPDHEIGYAASALASRWLGLAPADQQPVRHRAHLHLPGRVAGRPGGRRRAPGLDASTRPLVDRRAHRRPAHRAWFHGTQWYWGPNYDISTAMAGF